MVAPNYSLFHQLVRCHSTHNAAAPYPYQNSPFNSAYFRLTSKRFGPLASDFEFFNSLLDTFISTKNKTPQEYELIQQLLKTLERTLDWRESMSYGSRDIPGIYILYNKMNGYSYIGETNSLERRFNEHRNQLLEGRHTNKGLSLDIGPSSIDNLTFLVRDYGKDYTTKQKRLKSEVQLISSWPGQVYNIKSIAGRNS